MNYDAMGSVPAGYAPRIGAAYGYPMAYAPGAHFDIIGRRHALARMGADPAPAPAEGGVWNWFQKEGPLGVKRLYWAGGAVAVGLTWLAWSKGWLGGDSHASAYDF